MGEANILYNGNVPLSNDTLGVNMLSNEDKAYRGLFSGWFNSANIAKEEWRRSETSGNNALARDLYYLNASNQFNALEAEKNRSFQSEEAQIARDYETEMSNSAYQRAVSDMKIAGINPIVGLGLSNNGASTPSASVPSGSTASSGGQRSSSAYSGQGRSIMANTDKFVGTLLSVIGGLITGGAGGGAGALLTQSFDKDGELMSSSIKSRIK